MTLRSGLLVGAVVLAAAVAGVATSQQPPPSPVAATQADLPRSREDNAALAEAGKDPLAARLRGSLGQDAAANRFLVLVDASSVPVLAPADPALLRTAHLYTGDRHYMITAQRGTQIIEIYGATKAFRSPIAPTGGRPARAPVATFAPNRAATNATVRTGPRMAAARLPAAAARAAIGARAAGLANIRSEPTESGVDVSFSRFGDAYNVSFICEGPGADGCAEADAIVFATSLQLIGGGGS